MYNVVWSLLDNITQAFYLCSVCPYLTDNFYEKYNLYSYAGMTLHRNTVQSSCPNTCEKTLHRKSFCAMLAQSAQTCFCRKITYIILFRSACANIAPENTCAICLSNAHCSNLSWGLAEAWLRIATAIPSRHLSFQQSSENFQQPSESFQHPLATFTAQEWCIDPNPTWNSNHYCEQVLRIAVSNLQ